MRRIDPVFVERVWGRHDLAPLFGKSEKRIGEVWFPIAPEFPLLVKFLFTDDKLSVQVHPDDAYAREHENSRGKSEMWHILAAEPGATIAIGFVRQFSREEVRAAIADGSVEQQLNWVPVQAGDTFYTPAGVVHAIGAGIVLCEIQQNSDVTYRLYDYARPRELHLERGLAVARTSTHDGRCGLPVRCEHFTTDLSDPIDDSPAEGEHLLIVLAGSGSFNGERFDPGQVWHVPKGTRLTVDHSEEVRFLRTRCADSV